MNLKHRLASLLFLFFLLADLNAQNLDSLKQILKSTTNDVIRCKTLCALAEFAPDGEWEAYNEELKNLTEKKLNTGPTSGPVHDIFLNYYADALDNSGSICSQKGDLAGAFDCFNKALPIYEKLGDKKGTAGSLNKIALLYIDKGDIATALTHFAKSLKLREEVGDPDGIANSLNNIGLVYEKQGDLELAMSYYTRCLAILKKTNNIRGLNTCLGNIAGIYFRQGDIKKTFEYTRRVLKIRDSIGDTHGVSVTLNNIAEFFGKSKQYDSAIFYNNKSIELKEKIGDKKGLAKALNNRGMYYFAINNNSKAIEYLSKARAISEKAGYTDDVKSSSGNLYQVLKKTGHYREALENYETHILMRDSVASAVNKKAAIKHNLQYEYDKKAAADSVKNAEQEKVKNAQLTAQQSQLKQEKTQRFALYGGLILVIAFLGFVFNRFKITQKQKLIIQQQKEQVDIAFEQLHEKNKEITDSINYAQRIQRSQMSTEKYIEKTLKRLQKQE